jgi:hypothetical protein
MLATIIFRTVYPSSSVAVFTGPVELVCQLPARARQTLQADVTDVQHVITKCVHCIVVITPVINLLPQYRILEHADTPID